jgi:hypothetical protein
VLLKFYNYSKKNYPQNQNLSKVECATNLLSQNAFVIRAVGDMGTQPLG